MIQINRIGLNYSDNVIDPLLSFNTPQTWNVSNGTGSATISTLNSFEGDSSLRIESTEPVKVLNITNNSQNTVIKQAGDYAFSIYLNKPADTISGSVKIFNNSVLLGTEIFENFDVENKWLLFVSGNYSFNANDLITFSFEIDAEIGSTGSKVLFVDGFNLFRRQTRQLTPPFYTKPISLLNNFKSANNEIIVNSVSDFGVIDSTKQYVLGSNIDMGTTSLDLSGGKKLSIRGKDFNVSGLFSTADNYTMITGADAGDINFFDISIEVSGTNSKVYGIVSQNGFNAIECVRVNYNNCSSLGFINNYRQGLEDGTGRFGGTPTLELIGNWVGGFRISTSIVRGLSSSMNSPLFKAGLNFVMNNRFKTDINADLNSSASLVDFSESNFSTSELLQFQNCIVSRNGFINPLDQTIFPNINEKVNQSNWRNNVGLPNTDKGGLMTITTQATTTISTVNEWVDVAGTFTLTRNQHTQSDVNGQLKSNDATPTDYKVISVFTLDGTANDVFEMRATIFRSATSTFEPQEIFREAIDSNLGGNDIGKIVMFDSFSLNENDYVKYEIRNTTSTNNVLALENRCKFRLESR